MHKVLRSVRFDGLLGNLSTSNCQKQLNWEENVQNGSLLFANGLSYDELQRQVNVPKIRGMLHTHFESVIANVEKCMLTLF